MHEKSSMKIHNAKHQLPPEAASDTTADVGCAVSAIQYHLRRATTLRLLELSCKLLDFLCSSIILTPSSHACECIFLFAESTPSTRHKQQLRASSLHLHLHLLLLVLLPPPQSHSISFSSLLRSCDHSTTITITTTTVDAAAAATLPAPLL
jgi:hypothetical protein